jgi:hypothetical protein
MLVMEVLHRYSGLEQRMIAERFGDLDEGLVSRDRGAIREKIKTEPKIRSSITSGPHRRCAFLFSFSTGRHLFRWLYSVHGKT